jgi:glucokinase
MSESAALPSLSAGGTGPSAGDRAATAYPALVADVGGTFVRFALVDSPGAAVRDVRAFRCAEFASLEEAAAAYLADVAAGARPISAAFALACAIDGDAVRMTNNPWTIARSKLQQALGARHVRLINDFEALALALPRLRRDEIDPIGTAAPDASGPMAVVGPGTGLGVACCVPVGERWVALPTEGGHVTAAAADDFEAEVLRVARGEFAHVSAERLVSGMGLPLLHRAVATARGVAAESLPAEEIARRALTLNDPDCLATLDTFCAMLGTFAGNVALTVGARGGVFIAGGIVQKLGRFFEQSRFRSRFEAKGRFAGYLAAIGTAVITAPHPALAGAAAAIGNETIAAGQR